MVYKIISPSGKIYIGESGDINTSFRYDNNLQCKNQVRLYNSFSKYGVENHIFEILEEGDDIDLLNRERFYQLKYNAIGKQGLNCQLTEVNGKKYSHSQATKDKIGRASLNRKHSDETRAKISRNITGRKLSKEHKLKMSINRTGKPLSNKTKRKISKSHKGKVLSQITKDKISKIQTGRKLNESWKQSIRDASPRKKTVLQLDLDGNIICRWSSVREVTRKLGIDNGSISKLLPSSIP